MNKYCLILTTGIFLFGCGSSIKSEQQDPNALPNGIMQPVGGDENSIREFMPDIQQNSMPKAMK